jgi:L-histidine N-alpha-methyltransferase
MRRFAAREIEPATRQQFGDDVEYYLSLNPRQLPSQYLYDDLGSALFDAICHLPWYRITRAELALLERHAADIRRQVGSAWTLVELGPGSGEKLATIVDAVFRRAPLAVHLVDISAMALASATRSLDSFHEIRVIPHLAPYEVGLAETVGERAGRTLTLFLGSNIGNFDPPGAAEFLNRIRVALRPHDMFLLGADLIKPERDLLLAYDDPLQVTAAFNRNLLVRVNRELGGDFEVGRFAHRAVWNDSCSRVEMHLVSLDRQRVRIPGARLDIEFQLGETIWTESSYKYRPDGIVEMLEHAGFICVAQWLDETDGFALTLARAA